MSMRTFIVSGYGFPTEEITALNAVKFLQKHRTTVEKACSEIVKDALNALDKIFTKDFYDKWSENCDPYDFEDVVNEAVRFNLENGREAEAADADSFDWDCISVEEIIAAIMKEETGIGFTYEQGSEYSDPAILLAKVLPWSMTEAEKAISNVETMNGICSDYLQELGLETTCLDYLDIEYYG